MNDWVRTTLCLLVLASAANARNGVGQTCEWGPIDDAQRAIRHASHDRVRLSADDAQTVVLAMREILAICARGSSASRAEVNRRDTLVDLVDRAMVGHMERWPGGTLAMVTVFSAERSTMKTLAQGVCNPAYVNIEPFIVTVAGGAQKKPDEGYVLIQRTEGGDAAFTWRELLNGGAAIPRPGREYTVTVLAFLAGTPFRARQAVNSAALIPVPGRPGCRLVVPQLTAVRQR